MVKSIPLVVAIDALDECPEARDARSDRVILFLRELQDAGARVIVTSRIEFTQLEAGMRAIATQSVRLHDEYLHLCCVRTFVRSQLTSLTEFRTWPDELRGRVEAHLVNKSNGMFLWVHLQLAQLRKVHPHSVLAALGDLPRSLHATYQRILETFSRDAHWSTISRASHVLQCASVSRQALDAGMVVDLCDFQFPRSDSSLPDAWPRDFVLPFTRSSEGDDPGTALLKFCPSLLHWNSDVGLLNSPVQLIHSTAAEFLQSEACRNSPVRVYGFTPGLAHATWFRICWSIVTHYRCYYGNNHGLDGIARVLLRTPGVHEFHFWPKCVHTSLPGTMLLSYAEQHWIHHLCAAMDSFPDSLAPHVPEEFKVYASLQEACDQGHWTTARWLLANGVSPTHPDHPTWLSARSPILRAVEQENVDITAILVDCGAIEPLNDKALGFLLARALAKRDSTRFGAAFLRSAAPQPIILRYVIKYGGSVDLVRLAIAQGASLDGQDNAGNTALHIAAAKRLPRHARALVLHTASIDTLNNVGQTPLHRASASGDLDTVALLLERGASVAAKDKRDMTALLHAASGGHVEACAALHAAGSDLESRSTCGETVMHFAAQSGQLDTLRFFLELHVAPFAENQELSTPLHLAAWAGHIQIVEELVQYSVDVTIANRDGMTPLHWAAFAGSEATCALLLSAGYDVAATDQRGDTALHIAINRGHFRCIHLLLDHHAPLCVANRYLETPLQIAVWRKFIPVVEHILEKGDCLLNMADLYGNTALHISALSRNIEMCRLLTAAGSNARAVNADGDTPLHLAVTCFDSFDVCCCLIDADSDVTATNTAGDTPLHLATSRDVDVVHLLLFEGASVSIRNASGHLPINIASPAPILDTLFRYQRSKNNGWPLSRRLINRPARLSQASEETVSLADADICKNPPVGSSRWG